MTDATKKSSNIAAPRAAIGAPSGTIDNPTVWLFVVVWCVLVGSTFAWSTGALPTLLMVLINGVAIYWNFTVMHESMHGIAHADRNVNCWLGRIAGLSLMVSLPMFRGVHYEHHSHTNDTERDPDLFVGHAPAFWLVPLWSMYVLVEYRLHYYGRRLWRKNTRERNEALVMESLLLAIIVGALLTGNFSTLALVWIAPALLAAAFLVAAFDYLPHYPYDSDQRYLDTRVYPGRVAEAVLLGQNYHLIHHLWTTIPWFRYRGVFEEIRPQLEQRGSRIGWRVQTPQPVLAQPKAS